MARDWCCERFRDETSSPGGWEARAIQEGYDDVLNLFRIQPYKGGKGGVATYEIPFSYCPFCGSEVNHD